MSRGRPLGALWPAAVLTAGAAYYAIGILWLRALRGMGIASHDTYAFFYPNVLYALDSLRDGGGLLWNPYQVCGQPFFAISTTGLLYPVHVVFAVFDREIALAAAALIHLLIGGTGMFLLCRELRLGVVPALCGALAFQLGGTAATLAAWTPLHVAPYMWMAVAMWRAERLLRQPRLANAAWLGVVLTVQLLPGFPQTVVFTYQLIVLRTAWALLAGQLQRPAVTLGVLAVGCALPPFLGAIQLLPSFDVMRDSLRSLPLDQTELGLSFTWASLRKALRSPAVHMYPGNALVPVVAMLSVVAFCRRRPGSLALFFLGVGVVYAFLSLGPNGSLFPWYAALPMGSAFRMPIRFLWVSAFALAVLTAYGADALLRQPTRTSPLARGTELALLAAGAGLFFAAAGRPPTAVDWLAMATLGSAVGLLAWSGRAALPALLVILAVSLNLALASRVVINGLRMGDLYGANADAFTRLRERMTPQNRVALIGTLNDLAFLPKSASLFRVASIYDYEAQVSRSYAEFFTWLRLDRAMGSIQDWYYPFGGVLPAGFNRRLFDLTAARYVLVDQHVAQTTGQSADWRVVERNPHWTLYENPTALARARFVPQIDVVSAAEVLPLLARGARDPTRVALVAHAPASGFHGQNGEATGEASVVVDEPERVVVQVDAPAAGFLFLADQYANGWEARVDEAPAEILRANHVFRLVEVPAGRSQVEFRYRPRSLYVGALVSALTAAVLLVGAAGGLLHHRRAAHA